MATESSIQSPSSIQNSCHQEVRRPTENHSCDPRLGLNLHGLLRLLTYWTIFFMRPVGYSTMGVFMVEFAEYFHDATQAQISWIGACHMGVVPLGASMLIGVMTERFGSRIVVAITALIGSCGLVLSSVVPNLPSLYIGYGVMLGFCVISYQIIGSILIQTTIVVRRNLIGGLSFSLISAGAFVWPAVSRVLIDVFCWQGALLILGAINLNVVALSLLLPNTSTTKKDKEENLSKQFEHVECEYEIENLYSQNGGIYDRQNEHKEVMAGQSKLCYEQKDSLEDNNETALEDLNQQKPSAMTKEEQFSKKHPDEENIQPNKNGSFTVETTSQLLQNRSIKQRLQLRTESVCGKPSYTLISFYCIGFFFNQISLYSIFMYLPTRCKDEGYTKRQAVLLVSVVSVAGCIFRTPAGALGDIKAINPCFVTAAAKLITGITCILSVYSTNIVTLAVCSFVMGSALAFFVGMVNPCAEYLGGQSRLGMGFSMINTAQGVSMIIALPLSGYFLDHIGSSQTLFLYSGGCGIMGGILVLITGLLRRSTPCTTHIEYDPSNHKHTKMCI